MSSAPCQVGQRPHGGARDSGPTAWPCPMGEAPSVFWTSSRHRGRLACEYLCKQSAVCRSKPVRGNQPAPVCNPRRGSPDADRARTGTFTCCCFRSAKSILLRTSTCGLSPRVS